MSVGDDLGNVVASMLRAGKIVAVIDYDIASFTYLDALRGISDLLEEGRYVWVVSYEPLQSIFRDFNRAGVDYGEYLDRNLIIVDVFGSFRKVSSGIKGVYTLGGYLDDRVFVLKYRSLIEKTLVRISPEPEETVVVGYLESGMCRLFSNPVRTQKFLWSLREEFSPKVAGLITYIQPECPSLEEFIHMYSDVVFVGSTLNGSKRVILAKGEVNEAEPRY